MRVSLSAATEDSDSTSAWDSASEGEGSGESVLMANLSNRNVNARPPTPHWSENEPWASTLENITLECINDLNAAVQSSCHEHNMRNGLNNPGSSFQPRPGSEPMNVNQSHDDHPEPMPLDLLDRALEQIFDDAKAKAKAIFRDQISPHVRNEALGWFQQRMNVVMGFLGYMGDAIKKAMKGMINGVKGAWASILRTLRIGVAKKAVAAVRGVRNLHSVTGQAAAGSGHGTTGTEDIPLRVL